MSINSIGSQQSKSSRKTIKNTAKLENQLYQIFKSVDACKNIMEPIEIQALLRQYLKILREREPAAGLTVSEFEPIQILYAINQVITAQELYMLIRNNFNQSGLLIPFFTTKWNYPRTVCTLLQLSTQQLQPLYTQSLKSGLLSCRNSILPYYIKKIVQTYCPMIGIPALKIEQISIPQLIQIIQNKAYHTALYRSVLMGLIGQLFAHFRGVVRVLAAVIDGFVARLTALGHQKQLIMSFIGQLLYQVCYFTYQAKMNLLTNAVYMQQKYTKSLSIKEKKIIQMLREGGFKGFGYQIQEIIMPIVEANKMYCEGEQHYYQLVRVEKPGELHQLYKLLTTCHNTPTTNRIAKFLEYKAMYGQVLARNGPMVAYIELFGRERNWETIFQLPTGHDLPGRGQQRDGDVDTQFHSIAERILRSESGIFQDMVRLNPTIKIAGIPLKEALKSLSSSQLSKASQPRTPAPVQKKGQIQQQACVDEVINPRLSSQYQYVQLVISSRDRYIGYHGLSEVEKLYFQESANTIVDNRDGIREYLRVCQKMRNIRAILS